MHWLIVNRQNSLGKAVVINRGKTLFRKTASTLGLHLRQIWFGVRNDIRKIKYKK